MTTWDSLEGPTGVWTNLSDPTTAASIFTIRTGSSVAGMALHVTSSDVSHNATHIVPTDVFAYIAKSSSASGGGVFGGVIEAGNAVPGVVLAGTAGQPSTSKSTTFSTSRAIIELQALTHDGAGTTTAVNTGGNVVGIATRRSGGIQSIWLLDEAGTSWQPGNVTAEGLAITSIVSTSAATMSVTGHASFGNAVLVNTIDGVDVNPGSDADVDLVTVGVTGSPKIWWDESDDNIVFSKGVQFAGTIRPSTDDGGALGTTNTKFSDLFLASGGVVNFNSGDVTITHSASNELTIAGGLVRLADEVRIDGALDHNGASVGFYGTAPTAKQTGVAVTAEAIHAALVTLGLIGA